MNEAFRHYYENLYCLEDTNNLDIQSDFLGKLDIPQIPKGTRDSLDGDVTIFEISEAVSARNVKWLDHIPYQLTYTKCLKIN